MIRSCPFCWLATAVLTACASTAGASDPDGFGPGSSVEYVVPRPGRAPRAPAAPPARAVPPSRAAASVVKTSRAHPAPRDSGAVREVVRGSSGSVIRYEPLAATPEGRAAAGVSIDDAAPNTARVVPPIEDELVGRDDHADVGDEGAVREDELPLEDRAGQAARAARARRETGGEVTRAGAEALAAKYAPHFIADDLAFPYPTDHVFRGFGPCVGKRHVHEAIDIGGVGPEWGIGTPIRAMTKAEIVFIGRGDENPDDFGMPDKRAGEAARGDKLLPRMKEIAPYGKVYFFTRRQGRWRSGNIIVTRALGGPLADATVRYLHLAAVHPALKVGDIVEAGEEIALMGGTGVQQSAPHLHLDIEAADGKRLDVAPILGLAPTASCKVEEAAEGDERAHGRDAEGEAEAGTEGEREGEAGTEREGEGETAKAPAPVPPAAVATRPVPAPVAAVRPARPSATADVEAEKVWTQTIEVPPCGTWSREESFASGKYDAHALAFDLKAGQKLALALERRHGAWAPAIQADVPRGSKFVAAKAGPEGQKATLEMKTAGHVVVRIAHQGPDAPPSTASYGLMLVDRCAAPKATPRKAAAPKAAPLGPKHGRPHP